MNEERTEKCLRQVEHIRGHLWHIYHNGQPSHGGNRQTLRSMPDSFISRSAILIMSFHSKSIWWFNFPIVNFPFICSNIPTAPAYIYISLGAILKTGFGESWQKCLVHVTLANDSHDKPRWQEYFQKCPYKAKSRVFTDAI
jgi:hypothetical protein